MGGEPWLCCEQRTGMGVAHEEKRRKKRESSVVNHIKKPLVTP